MHRIRRFHHRLQQEEGCRCCRVEQAGRARCPRRNPEWPWWSHGIIVKVNRSPEAALDLHNDTMAVLAAAAVEPDAEVNAVGCHALDFGLGAVVIGLDGSFPEDITQAGSDFGRRRERDKDGRLLQWVELRKHRDIRETPDTGVGGAVGTGPDHGRVSLASGLLRAAAEGRPALVEGGSWWCIKAHGSKAWGKSTAADAAGGLLTNIIIVHIEVDVGGRHGTSREGRKVVVIETVLTHGECVLICFCVCAFLRLRPSLLLCLSRLVRGGRGRCCSCGCCVFVPSYFLAV